MSFRCILRLSGLIGITLTLQAQPAAVYVVTHIDVMPNFAADTTKALREFASESKKDPGVIRFEVLQQDGRPNHYTIVELWRSRDAFEAHSASEHTRRFREKLHPMLGSPFDERLHALIQ